MWTHPATQRNINLLAEYGCTLIPPEHGELASGLVGTGRMAEPENIVAFLSRFFTENFTENFTEKQSTTVFLSTEKTVKTMTLPKNVLITSGPTYEAIDPVRFIGNRSSGKMGTALAEELAEKGMNVTLITGPTQQKAQHENIKTIQIESAAEMLAACEQYFEQADICIWAAAVADYRPKNAAVHKIKKTDSDLIIELESTTDIAKTLGAKKRPNQLLIGFALETNNAHENAIGKLHRKNLDAVVLNSTEDAGAGFNHDTNKVTIIEKSGKETAFPLKSKTEVAKDICMVIMRLIS
jgi:phosphopantothenoylcysteine decarboxylase/phosphopantothenate--cysteine ligase